MGCSCAECIQDCWHNPGWFGSVEEVEAAAKLLNMKVADFCREYLIQEYWKDDTLVPAPRRDFSRKSEERKKIEEEVSTLAPILKRMHDKDESRNGKGFVRASWGHNLISGVPCIFLTSDNKCMVHDSKPKECRETFGCKNIFSADAIPETADRKNIVSYWKNHQDWIKKIEGEIFG